MSPQMVPAQYSIPGEDAVLLEECTVNTFRAGGKGGQHVNKTDSAVRLTHLPTGIVVTCQRERSQYLNKQIALVRLRSKIETLLERPPERKPTWIPKREKIKRREIKKYTSVKKMLRKSPVIDD